MDYLDWVIDQFTDLYVHWQFCFMMDWLELVIDQFTDWSLFLLTVLFLMDWFIASSWLITFAQLVSYGPDRQAAMDTMVTALDSYVIKGSISMASQLCQSHGFLRPFLSESMWERLCEGPRNSFETFGSINIVEQCELVSVFSLVYAATQSVRSWWWTEPSSPCHGRLSQPHVLLLGSVYIDVIVS